MKRQDAVCLYMRAWVRLKSACSVETWTPVQITESFCLLPPPEIAFEAWAASCGLVIDEAVQEAMAEANDHGLSQLRAAGIKVEPKVEEKPKE